MFGKGHATSSTYLIIAIATYASVTTFGYVRNNCLTLPLFLCCRHSENMSIKSKFQFGTTYRLRVRIEEST